MPHFVGWNFGSGNETGGETNERGAFIPMMAVVALVLVLFIAALLVLGHGSMVKSELRSAANGAALNAANVLCSTETCWNNSRAMAIQTINRSTIHGKVTDAGTLNISGGPNVAYPPTWNLPNATVIIERGHWLPPAGGQINGTFESLENAAAWYFSHPAVPRYSIANAVRVTIRRPSLGKLLLKRQEVAHGMEASAVAVADAVEQAYAAPFALPVCSLLDSTGSYTKLDALRGERFFTRVDRYCPSGDCGCNSSNPSYPFCARVPGFPIEPKSHQYFAEPGSSFYLCDNRSGTKNIGCSSDSSHLFSSMPFCRSSPPDPLCSYNWDSYTAWHQSLFLKRSNHYGFVGVPDGDPAVFHQPTVEGQVISILNQPGGVRPAQIGDPIVILDNGLSSPAAELTVWNQISGTYGDDGLGNSDHPSMKDAKGQEVDQYYQSNGPELEENLWYTYGYCDIDYSPLYDTPPGPPVPFPSGFREAYGCHSPDSFAPDYSYLGPNYAGSRDRTFGVCNSKRMDVVSGLSAHDGWGALNDLPMWEVNVPVVADFSSTASACGTDPYLDDPRVSPRDDWRIIGFMRANIFDADVGRPSSTDYLDRMRRSFFYRFFSTEPVGAARFYLHPLIGQYAPYTMSDPTSAVPSHVDHSDEALRAYPSTPFRYAMPMDCDVVRGKLVIDSDLIPLSPQGLLPVRRGELRFESSS